MSKTTRDTIITIETGIQYEAVANAAIIPGQIVSLLSTGKIQKQATAGEKVEMAVAIEDYLQGNGIADVYASSARVLYRVFPKGAEVLLIVADGENIAIGDKLACTTGGEVKAQDTSTEELIVVAMEAVDVSDSAVSTLAERRINCRVI